MFRSDESREHFEPPPANHEVVMSLTELHASELGHLETSAQGSVIGVSTIELDHPVGNAVNMHVDAIFDRVFGASS